MVYGGVLMTAGMYGLAIGMLASQLWLSITAIIVVAFGFEISWGPIIWLYNAEIMQDKANSLAVVLNWMANLVITVLAPTIQQNIPFDDAGFLFLGTGTFMLIATLYAMYFIKETRNKTPAEIEALFAKDKKTE